MTKQINADSVITGNFCDVVNFFRERDIDDVDRLAQRALTVIFKTDHLVQTGDEVNPDPFVANMLASSALEAINCTLTTYPFLRESAGDPEADEDAVLASALELVEMAEGAISRFELMQDAPNSVRSRRRPLPDIYLNAFYFPEGSPEFGDGTALPLHSGGEPGSAPSPFDGLEHGSDIIVLMTAHGRAH